MRRRRLGAAALAVLIGLGCWWTLRSEPTSPTAPPEPGAPAADARRATAERASAERPTRRAPVDGSTDATDVGVTLVVRATVKGENGPVAGARVVAVDDDSHPHEATTDAAGIARIERFPGDYAFIKATAPGFARGTALGTKDELRGGETLEVRLEPAVAIDGVVREESSGRGVAGARVEIDGPHDPIASAVTAVDGTFHIDGAPANRKHRDTDGESRISLSLWAYEPHHVTSDAWWHPTDVGRVEIRMASAGVLRGRVTDPTGAPATGATVKAKPSAKFDGQDIPYLANDSAQSDADGRYELRGLPLGLAWRVVASKPKFADSEPCDDVVLEVGRTDEIRDFALRQAARLVVHVTRPDASPASGAHIRLVASGGRASNGVAEATGSYEVEYLAPGTWTLRVESSGLAATVVDVDLAPGERRVVDVKLSEGVTLAGVVVNDVGSPVAKAAVSAHMTVEGPAAMWPREAVTGSDGTFRIDGLPSGALKIDVMAAGGYELAWRIPATAPASDARFVLRRDGVVSFRLRAPTGGERPTTCGVALRPTRTRGFSEMSTRDLPWTDELFRVPVGVGTWNVSIYVPGFLFVTREVDVASGADTPLGEIVLDPGLTLEGRVVDAEGRPVAGASIDGAMIFSITGRKSAPSPSFHRTVRKSRSSQGIRSAIDDTDAAGRFRIEHVPAGSKTLVVLADGYADTVVATDVAAGSPPLVVTLRRGGALRAIVRDADGRTANGVDVEVTPADASIAMALALETSGAFTGRVRDGRARLVVRRGETTLATRDVDVREGEETSVEITLDR